jgi:hypothetical protein
MDDAKIDLIAREVLTSLKKAHAPVAPRPSGSALALHPSMQILSVSGGVVGSPCIIEPDKPCVGSLKCRTLGH